MINNNNKIPYLLLLFLINFIPDAARSFLLTEQIAEVSRIHRNLLEDLHGSRSKRQISNVVGVGTDQACALVCMQTMAGNMGKWELISHLPCFRESHELVQAECNPQCGDIERLKNLQKEQQIAQLVRDIPKMTDTMGQVCSVLECQVTCQEPIIRRICTNDTKAATFMQGFARQSMISTERMLAQSGARELWPSECRRLARDSKAIGHVSMPVDPIEMEMKDDRSHSGNDDTMIIDGKELQAFDEYEDGAVEELTTVMPPKMGNKKTNNKTPKGSTVKNMNSSAPSGPAGNLLWILLFIFTNLFALFVSRC